MVRFLQRVHIKKIHGIYCVRRAEERGCVVFLGTALFFSLQNGQTGPISFVELIGSLWRDFSRTRFK
jgi:hypothetical protein